jgi:LPPG:FO 2-phospho-L-lactate transferase
VRHHVTPMSDQPVRTIVLTGERELAFQRYFVAERCLPVAHGVRFDGADLASPSPGLKSALQRDDLAAVIICPSNPYLSVDPILAIPGVRAALAGLDAPVVAVSPIVGGKALKGPAAKIMAELGALVSPVGVASHYDGMLAAMVVDTVDGDQAAGLEAIGVRPLVTSTVMVSDYGRRRLADEVLSFAQSFARVGAKTASAS